MTDKTLTNNVAAATTAALTPTTNVTGTSKASDAATSDSFATALGGGSNSAVNSGAITAPRADTVSPAIELETSNPDAVQNDSLAAATPASARIGNQAYQAAKIDSSWPEGFDSMGFDSVGYDSVNGLPTGLDLSRLPRLETIAGPAPQPSAADRYGAGPFPTLDLESFAQQRNLDLTALRDTLKAWQQADASDTKDKSADRPRVLELGQGRFALSQDDNLHPDSPVIDVLTGTISPVDGSLGGPKALIPAGTSAVDRQRLETAVTQADSFGMVRWRSDFLANLGGDSQPLRDVEELADWLRGGRVGDPPAFLPGRG